MRNPVTLVSKQYQKYMYKYTTLLWQCSTLEKYHKFCRLYCYKCTVQGISSFLSTMMMSV